MPEGRTQPSRRLNPQKDGSYLIRYQGHRYAIRLRKHVETDTWDVVSIWSDATQSPLLVPAPPRGNRWEALLAGELNRSVAEALHAAERLIGSRLDRRDSERHPRAG
jgi:hypothetical protein